MSWTDLHELLLAPTHDRLLCQQPELSLSQWQARTLRLAASLAERNSQRIALHCLDSLNLASGLFAAWRVGAEVYLLGDAQPASLANLEGRVDLCLGDHQQAPLSDIEQLIANAHQPLAGQALAAEQACLWVCTSGSSGQPKQIRKTLAQLAAEVQVLEQLWGAQLGSAQILGSVATQHLYGLLFRLLWPMAAGRCLYPLQLGYPEDVLAQVQRQPRSAWVASPALLKRLPEHLPWPAQRERLCSVFSSGGPLPASASLQVAEWLGHAPLEIYGSSETGGIAWRQGGEYWQALPGVALSADESGALEVRSAFLPAGHCEVMADQVAFAAQGMRLLQRLDRIVKLEEKRIALPALEQRLEQHPWVTECRLGLIEAGRAHLGALVVLSAAGRHALRNGGRRALTEALRKHLRGHCENLALPRRWRLLEQLPVNAQGKLGQAQINALLMAERPRHAEVLSQHSSAEGLHLQLRIPLDLAHFSGHFPATPVVPGVLLIDWAIDFGRQHLQLAGRFSGMEVIKFQRLLRPGDEPVMTLRFDAAKGKLHFAVRCADEPCASGRIRWESTDV